MSENKPVIHKAVEVKPQPRRLKTISMQEALKLDLPPVKFYVEGLIPQGFTILASPPKFGKSWFVLDLCISVAKGGLFLGRKTTKVDTLYLALEDSPNRVIDRMKIVEKTNPIPEGCQITTSADVIRPKTNGNMQGGLIELLEQYLIDYPKTELIVIDTFQKIRGEPQKNESTYAYDYREGGALKKLADTKGIAIIIVHHLRKMKDDGDVFNQISGSTGLTGSADTTLAMNRTKRDDVNTTLWQTGRDIEEMKTLIVRNKQTQLWEVVGDADAEFEKQKLNAYNNEPIVKTIKKLVEKGGGIWKGSAQEIMNYCMEHIGSMIQTTPSNLSREIKKFTSQFYEIDNIIYTPPPPSGSGGKRHHQFKLKGYGFYESE